MNKLFCLVVVGLVCFGVRVSSETLYEGFSGQSSRWSILTAGDYDTSFAGNSLSVTSHQSALGIIADSATYDTFSLSIAIDPSALSYSDVGVAFCLQPESFLGYYFTVNSSKIFKVYKYVANSSYPEYLINFPATSLLSGSSSTLTVSRRGDQLLFFCNGAFLDSLRDDEYSQGRVGCVLAGDLTVEYRNLMITDDLVPILPPLAVSETFGGQWPQRWYTALSDPSAEFSTQSGGGLSAATQSATRTSVALRTGSFEGFSIEGVFEPSQDTNSYEKSSFFGIAFFDLIQKPDFSFTYRTYGFWVNADSTISIIRPDTTFLDSHRVFSRRTDSLHAFESPDTLGVFWDESTFHFVVNGDSLSSHVISERYFEVDAVGLIFDAGVKVVCHSFSAVPSNNPTTALTERPRAMGGEFRGLTCSGRNVNAFDLLGRRIPGLRSHARTLPAGVVFLRDEKQMVFPIRAMKE